MDDGKELTYVISSVLEHWAFKQRDNGWRGGSEIHPHPLVLHLPRVARAGGIDGDGGREGGGQRGEVRG